MTLVWSHHQLVRRPRRSISIGSASLPLVLAAIACSEPRPGCAADDAGLTLPPGFCAQIVADTLGTTRHVSVAPNGDIYIAVRNRHPGVIALRDTTGDGVADVRRDFGVDGGNDVLYHEGSLYFATINAILRWRIPAGALEPTAPPDTIAYGLLAMGQHGPKTFALGKDSALYVNIAAPSNTCQAEDRTAGSMGVDPCHWLDSSGGIWRFEVAKLRQQQKDGTRWATGIRNIMAISMDPSRTTLYGLQMGRDQLQRDWKELYSPERGAENPGEEFFLITEGGNYGWPYCYYDVGLKKKILNPEYGGDGKTEGRCAEFSPPLMAFPGHWAPEALVFYTGTSFPAKYHGGAFISFHGSFNRAPLPEAGFNVSFVPFADGKPSGEHEIFAEGFRPADGKGFLRRPMGLAVAPDGSLIVTDDSRGRLYRIRYVGN